MDVGTARRWPGRRWLWLPSGVTGLIGFVAIAYVVLQLTPDWFAETHNLNENVRARARQDVRIASLALLGGAIGVVGAIYTARSFALNRAGHLTDRFTNAIAQLGNTELDVRLGAIYALERIARDSSTDHPQVVEVLTAYVRGHAPMASTPPSSSHAHHSPEARPHYPDTPANSLPPRPDTDLQAVLTVLGRRTLAHEDKPPALDMSLTHLRGADLAQASLRGAALRSADLHAANLGFADLSGADLSEADLSDTDLSGANLSAANLHRADLNEANLDNADLRGTDLRQASLSAASLGTADLRAADLSETDLREANISGTDFRGANLSATDLRGTNLSGTDLRGANLSGADLRWTYLEATNLARARWDHLTLWPELFNFRAVTDHGRIVRAPRSLSRPR